MSLAQKKRAQRSFMLQAYIEKKVIVENNKRNRMNGARLKEKKLHVHPYSSELAKNVRSLGFSSISLLKLFGLIF